MQSKLKLNYLHRDYIFEDICSNLPKNEFFSMY